MIVGKYNIAVDKSGNQYTLTECTLNGKVGSKNFGEPMLTDRRYFLSWQALVNYATSNDMMEIVGAFDEPTKVLQETMKRMSQFESEVKAALKMESK